MTDNQIKVWTKADGKGNILKVIDFGKSKVENRWRFSIPVGNKL